MCVYFFVFNVFVACVVIIIIIILSNVHNRLVFLRRVVCYCSNAVNYFLRCSPGVILAFDEKGPVFFCSETVGYNCLTFCSSVLFKDGLVWRKPLL